MARNLHITGTSFRNESRLLRETASLARHAIFSEIVVVALHDVGLPEHERIDDARTVFRIILRSRRWSRNLSMQAIKYCELCWRVWRYARARRFQVVNVHSLDLLPLGALIKVTLRAKLVYDAHELETETNGLTGVRQSLARLTEKVFIRFADLIVVVSDGIRAWYEGKYGPLPIVTILNAPEFSYVHRTDLLRERLKIPSDKTISLYQGRLSRGRGIDFLLTAFAEFEESDHVLVFLGYGDLESKVREAAARSENIYLHPAVSPNELLAYTASADIGVSLIENTCLSYNLCLPNKLFEYVLAGLPVVVSDLPEMTKVVREGGVGAVLVSEKPSGLLSVLNQLSSMDRRKLHDNVAAFAQAYAWERQEKRMIAAYREHGIA